MDTERDPLGLPEKEPIYYAGELVPPPRLQDARGGQSLPPLEVGRMTGPAEPMPDEADATAGPTPDEVVAAPPPVSSRTSEVRTASRTSEVRTASRTSESTHSKSYE